MASKLSMKMAINEALDQEMQCDPSVIVLGEDIVGAGADGEKDAWGGVLGVDERSVRKAWRSFAGHAVVRVGVCGGGNRHVACGPSPS